MAVTLQPTAANARRCWTGRVNPASVTGHASSTASSAVPIRGGWTTTT